MDVPIFTALQHAFPQRTIARVSDFKRLSDGWENEVYGLRAEFTEKGQRSLQELILRVYPGDLAPAQQRAETEFRALKMLSRANYPVPQVYSLEKDPTLFGHPAILMEKIDGKPMWPELFSTRDKDNQEFTLRTFCRLFNDLHSLDWHEGLSQQEVSAVEVHSPTELIDRQFAKVAPVMTALPLPGFAPVMDWLQSHKRQAGGMRICLTHWDFHPNNILIRPDRASVVIDWTGIDLTDYRFDLAWTLVLIDSYEGSEWRERILREYERMIGSAVEALDFYEVFACCRRLYSMAASLKFGAESLGMRAGAEEMMRAQKEPMRRIYTLLLARSGVHIKEIEELLG